MEFYVWCNSCPKLKLIFRKNNLNKIFGTFRVWVTRYEFQNQQAIKILPNPQRSELDNWSNFYDRSCWVHNKNP